MCLFLMCAKKNDPDQMIEDRCSLCRCSVVSMLRCFVTLMLRYHLHLSYCKHIIVPLRFSERQLDHQE